MSSTNSRDSGDARSQAIGWSKHFQIQLELLGSEAEGLLPARVIAERSPGFDVAVCDDDGSLREMFATVPGRMKHLALGRMDLPVIGDWLLVEPLQGENKAVISRVFDRKSLLKRKVAGSEIELQAIAANVDIAFIVTSLNADLNLRRLERYLALVWDSGASPAILLTKSDLAPAAEQIKAIENLAPGVPVIGLSSKTGDGINELEALLEVGKTYCAIGSSGVGKSTLVNRLAGAELLDTGKIREGDDKGRHTTTARHLVRLKGSGAIFIDTPGMRELALFDAEDGVEAAFSDVAAIALKCRFTDCQHTGEPGCAIGKALADGVIDGPRLASYQKLVRELAHQARKREKAAAAKEKERVKQMHVEVKLKAKAKEKLR